MKKFVIFALIAAMTAGVAFAQTADGISVNGFGRGVFVPLQAHSAAQKDGETPSGVEGINYAGTAVTWGADYGGMVRTDFRVNGNAEFVGFQIQITEGNTDGGLQNDANYAGRENTNIWAKPFGGDILKLTIGRYEVDNLRGKIATDTGFESFVVGGIDEDKIFHRFRGNGGKANAIITSEPMEGLFIGLEVPGVLNNADWGKNNKLLDAYRKMQIGFGYQIPDIGHFRAQWLGGWFGSLDPDAIAKDVTKGKYESPIDTSVVTLDQDKPLEFWTGGDPARIEVAFALTAVDGLLVDLGLKFWLPIEAGDDIGPVLKGSKFSNGVDLGLGATYRADAFAIAASVIANFGKYVRLGDDDKYAKKEGMSLGINLIPTYDLDAATIGASIGLRTKGVSKIDGESQKDNTMEVGFGGFVRKDLGSGHIKAGLAYAAVPTKNGKGEGSGVFTIPIILEYGFW
jgi:hypothetical protein